MSKQKIVIIGGGFGGVTLAQRLTRKVSATHEITLVSSENHFVFTPMLAEVVGRAISPLHVVVAGRQMLPHAHWLTAAVTKVDIAESVVTMLTPSGEKRELNYHHLVLACGSVVNLNIMPGMAVHAYPLKSLGDVIVLSNDLIAKLERASVESDAELRKRLLTVVVIGGGFSGVEVAGEISELMQRTKRFYPELKEISTRIVLLQHGDHLLPELASRSLSDFTLKKLRAGGVEVMLQTGAQEISAHGVQLKSGEFIEADTIVSTVGNTTNPLINSIGLPLDHGRLVAESDMRVKGATNLWALGDCAQIPNAYDNKPSPTTAQFAMRQANQLADNIKAAIVGETTRPFYFKPLGMMASLGNRSAVAEVFGFKFSGLLAWMMWRSVYLGKLPTFARKLEVVVDWTWKLLFPPNMVELKIARTERINRVHYQAGDFVFHKDDPSKFFYLIEKGSARVILDDAIKPVLLKAGDHFGESALLGQPESGYYGASVQAETALDLIRLQRDDFLRLSESLGALRKEVNRTTAIQKGFEGLIGLVKKEPQLVALKVKDVMTDQVITIAPEFTLTQAVNCFNNGKPGYPVVDEQGQLKGYCGRAELYDALRWMPPLETRVKNFMRSDLPTISEQSSLIEATKILMQVEIEILPVLAGDGSGRVVGVLSPIDIFLKLRGFLDKPAQFSQAGGNSARN